MTDQCVIEIAAVAQDVILLLTAALIAWYLLETYRLRVVGQHQVEAQHLPAIVAVEGLEQVGLANVGNGPALSVEWRLKAPGTKPVFSDSTEAGDDILTFLDHDRKPKITAQKPVMLTTKELHCLYRSLSGRRYVSVSKFTVKAGFATSFREGPR